MKLFRVLIVLALLICLAPLISTAVAGWIAQSHGCTLHEGFVNPCLINGTDYGATLYQLGMMGWFMLITIPIGALLILFWVVIEILARLRRNQTRA